MNLLIVGFLYSVAMGDAVGIRMSRRLGEGQRTIESREFEETC